MDGNLLRRETVTYGKTQHVESLTTYRVALKEIQNLRQICRYLPLLSLVPFCVSLASAQSAVDINVGFGGAWDSASKTGIDFNSATGLCTSTYPADPYCQATKALSGFMLGFGGDVMFKPKFGVGIEYAVQPAQQDYAPLNASTNTTVTSTEIPVKDRQSFYDFNAVYRPIQTKRAALNIEAGIGGARTSLSYTQTSCVGAAVCASQSGAIGIANHFQEHIGIGAQIYVTDHFFIRPQLDLHIVQNFSGDFGSGFVPTAMVWVGYNLGSK